MHFYSPNATVSHKMSFVYRSRLNVKCRVTNICISIIHVWIRRSHGHLIFIMGTSIPGKPVLILTGLHLINNSTERSICRRVDTAIGIYLEKNTSKITPVDENIIAITSYYLTKRCVFTNFLCNQHTKRNKHELSLARISQWCIEEQHGNSED